MPVVIRLMQTINKNAPRPRIIQRSTGVLGSIPPRLRSTRCPVGKSRPGRRAKRTADDNEKDTRPMHGVHITNSQSHRGMRADGKVGR